MTASDHAVQDLLSVLARVGIIEPGYVGASLARGFTAVRLPWIRKDPPPFEPDTDLIGKL